MRFLLPLLLLGILLTGCGNTSISVLSPDGTKEVPVMVEIADEPKEQERGLMGRAVLQEGTGMLFVFDEPQILSFWMKDTLIPLEILYFDAEGNFVNSLSMEPCTEPPCDNYPSASLARYALEVNPGFREANGIAPGWRLDSATIARFTK
jgi:uncharacterized protein